MTEPAYLRALLRRAFLELLQDGNKVDHFIGQNLPELAQKFESESTNSARLELLLNARSTKILAEGLARSFPQTFSNLAETAGLAPAASAANAGVPLLACVYAPEDKAYFNAFADHLSPVTMMAQAALWHMDDITPGFPRIETLLNRLETADLIVILLSPDLFAMPKVKSILRLALRLNRTRTNVMVPVLIRPVMLETTPLRNLARLPTNGSAIASCENQDEAWVDVVKGVRRLLPFSSEDVSYNIPPSTSVSVPAVPADATLRESSSDTNDLAAGK